ncbi:MAG: redoxin domain-containing protein [Armatimonadota bacterium]
MKTSARFLSVACLIFALIMLFGCGAKKPPTKPAKVEKPAQPAKSTKAKPAKSTKSEPIVTQPSDLILPEVNPLLNPLASQPNPADSAIAIKPKPAPKPSEPAQPKLTAKNVMAALQNTYRNFKSLKTEGTSFTEGTIDGKRAATQKPVKVVVRFVRPDKLSISNNEGRLVSDGKTVYNYIPEAKGYMKTKMSEEIVTGLITSRPGINVLGLLYGVDYQKAIASSKLLPDSSIGSSDVYVVSLNFKDGVIAPKGTSITQTLWIGKSDMCLHKTLTTLSAHPKPNKEQKGRLPRSIKQVITTTVTKYEPNLDIPASTFAFKPPSGARLIEPPKPYDLRGKSAPDFAFEWENGEIKHLSDFKGGVVLLDFISLPMCDSQLPVLKKVHENLNTLAQLIIVSLDKDKAKDVAYLKEKGFDSLPVVFIDEANAKIIEDQYRLIGLPVMFMLDETGQVQAQAMGVASEEQIKKKLNEMAASRQ